MNVVLTQAAEKQLLKLPTHIQNRIFSKFEEIENHPNPLLLAKPISACLFGTYRFRVANKYRAIFRVKDCTLVIGRIGHRNEIYK